MWRKRLLGVASFFGGAAWQHWGWEAVRAWIYERGFHLMNPYLFGVTPEQALHWGPTIALVSTGTWLFWKTWPSKPPEVPRAHTTRAAFSETQSIKILPPQLGGNMTLSLDNVATMRLHAPYSMTMVTLILDVVPVDMDVQHHPGVQVAGAKVFHHDGKNDFVFDVSEHKRREITVEGRTFIVTLREIKKLDIPGVARPIEYVFGISER